MPQPLTTVVTPTRNAMRYIHATLESIRSQGPGVEHIVVDDASTDGTRELVTKAGSTLIEGDGRGLYAAMTKGLDAASGDVLSVLNADDLLLPGAIATAREVFRGTASEAWLVGAVDWIDGSGHSHGTMAAPPSWMSARMFSSLGWSAIVHPAVFMTRPLWRAMRPFDEQLTVAADYDLFARTLKRLPYVRVPQPLAAFRRHGDNESMTNPMGARDVALVADRHGYADAARRRAARGLLKSWMNGRNPRWAIAKRLGRLP